MFHAPPPLVERGAAGFLPRPNRWSVRPLVPGLLP